MSRRLASGAVSTKLIVALVLLAVVSVVYWGVRLTRNPADQISPDYRAFLEKQTYILWCPECGQEFVYQGVEARQLPTQGEGEARAVQCPKCKKFIAKWGGRPAEPSTGDNMVNQP